MSENGRATRFGNDPSQDPVLCSPYEEPDRYWGLDRLGRAMKGRLPVPGRRPSMAVRSTPKDAKDSDPQIALELTTQDLNETINAIRGKVKTWRNNGYPGATRVTGQLLRHWADGEQCLKQPFFAQQEAIETLIWLREVATRGTPERRSIEELSRRYNDGIVRHCVKQATGTGKTVVMAMLIAWQTLNAVRTSRSRNLRHGQRFAVIAPGLTVRDRLAVLRPTHPDNIYDEYGLVPPGPLRRSLNRAKVAVVNWQAFQPRDLLGATGHARKLLEVGDDIGRESRQAAAERVLRDLIRPSSAYGDLVVINDEAHHCWLPDQKEHKGGKDVNSKAAAVWFNAIRALRDAGHLGRMDDRRGQASVVYDFSATPMWIDTTSKARPRLFEWVVSDFGLMESIESGLVKVPRVPCDDDASADQTVWRNLYGNSHHKRIKANGEPLQEPLKGAMSALYEDYKHSFRTWKKAKTKTPPVMIVVANTIPNAVALYDWIAGAEGRDGSFRPGKLPLFSNVRADGSGWEDSPRTLLVHSKLDTDEKLPSRFAKLVKDQVGRFDDRAADPVQAMRRMMNTVGKPGRPGERVRCVVSVSMLTEGWDTRTVTHVLGYRRFGTQLLCEQVTGRALRRVDYQNWREIDDGGRIRRLLNPEYADVVGIPFEFMPSGPIDPEPPEPKPIHIVKTVPGRQDRRITFPLVEQYMTIPPQDGLTFHPDLVEPYSVDVGDIPTMTLITGVAGEEKIIEISRQDTRLKTAKATLAAMVVRRFVLSNGDAEGHRRSGLFRGAYRAVEQWISHPHISIAEDDPMLLLRADHREEVVDRILTACRPTPKGGAIQVAKLALPPLSDTDEVRFETTLSYIHETAHSELNLAACHSGLELECARQLDRHPRVTAWARNFQLGWTIPYRSDGVWHLYTPDFAARLDNGLNLIIEGKGRPDPKWEHKKRFVIEHWIPSVAKTEAIDPELRRWGLVELNETQRVRTDLDKAIRDTD